MRVVPVPEDQLPVTLPDVTDYEPTDTGESPLAAVATVNVKCPKCGGDAKRETDTMPNWRARAGIGCGTWTPQRPGLCRPRQFDYWGQVDLYLGGMEHTTLHLLYSRFWHSSYTMKPGADARAVQSASRQGKVLASDGRR